MLQNYNLGQTDKVSIIKNWLGREGLQLIATFTQEEQETCNNEQGLFDTLKKKIQATTQWNNKMSAIWQIDKAI